MNKVNLSPFLTIKDSPQKEVTPTPRLLSKNKKTNAHINKLRVSKKQSVDNEEIFHFDDTACFREFNKFAASTEGLHQDQPHTKKCCSQILAVKMMEENRPSPFSEHQPTKAFQRQGDAHHIDTLILLSQENRQEAADKIRNYTSQSSRRKYFRRQQASRNMLPTHFFGSKEHSNFAESTMFPPSSPFRSQPSHQRQKSKPRGWELSPGQALRNDKSEGEYTRKSNFLQYSIIKPEEIKSLALLVRKHEKESQQKKRRDQKAFYLQMMQQIKKKEEILKRNAKLKEELENSSQRARQVAKRPILYSSATHRNNYLTVEEKNELRPWQVDTFANDIL